MCGFLLLQFRGVAVLCYINKWIDRKPRQSSDMRKAQICLAMYYFNQIGTVTLWKLNSEYITGRRVM